MTSGSCFRVVDASENIQFVEFGAGNGSSELIETRLSSLSNQDRRSEQVRCAKLPGDVTCAIPASTAFEIETRKTERTFHRKELSKAFSLSEEVFCREKFFIASQLHVKRQKRVSLIRLLAKRYMHFTRGVLPWIHNAMFASYRREKNEFAVCGFRCEFT